MVDVDRIEARIERLEETLERLEEVRARGEDAYLADPQLRAMAERAVFASLSHLDDLRKFGAAVAELVDAPSETDTAP